MSKSTTTRSTEGAALKQLMETVEKLSIQVSSLQDRLATAEDLRLEAVKGRDEANRRAEVLAERHSSDVAALKQSLEAQLENGLRTRSTESGGDRGRTGSGGDESAAVNTDDHGSGDRSHGQTAVRSSTVESMKDQPPPFSSSEKDFPG